MNTILGNATKSLLPEFWIWRNRQYVYHHPNMTPTSLRKSSLPMVSKEHETVLRELDIPYKIIDWFENEMCQYWDSAVCEEEEIRLPVYTKIGNDYRFVQFHTGKRATPFMVEQANGLENQVRRAIEKFEEKKRKEEFFKLVKESLGERQAILFYDEANDVPIEMDYVCGEDRFKAIPVTIPAIFRKGWSGNTYWYACFNVNKIELNSVVKLEKVPKGKAGMVIGFNGWQTKEWCRKLGVKFIKVVEL